MRNWLLLWSIEGAKGAGGDGSDRMKTGGCDPEKFFFAKNLPKTPKLNFYIFLTLMHLNAVD